MSNVLENFSTNLQKTIFFFRVTIGKSLRKVFLKTFIEIPFLRILRNILSEYAKKQTGKCQRENKINLNCFKLNFHRERAITKRQKIQKVKNVENQFLPSNFTETIKSKFPKKTKQMSNSANKIFRSSVEEMREIKQKQSRAPHGLHGAEAAASPRATVNRQASFGHPSQRRWL